MPNGWRTIKSLEHEIRLYGRRGKGMAESFWREKLRHALQKEGGWEILCDPGWYVQRTWCPEWMENTHTHTLQNIHRCIHSSAAAVSEQSESNERRTSLVQGVRTWGPIGPPSSVVGNALVVIDDGIASVNVKNRYQGARVSARGQTVNLKMVFGGNLYMVV